MYKIYSEAEYFPIEPKHILVEDSNSGYEFFKGVTQESDITCESAGGKTKLYSLLCSMKEETCVIADGAAIGAEMEKLHKLSQMHRNVKLYLPESFEWIILNSGLIEGKDISEILAQPENFIESQEYFSWERYFTKLLSQKTEGTVYKYQKSKLNPVYLHERNRKAIVDSIEGIKLIKED